MSKKSHQKELERARAKRAAAADSRSKRTRIIAIVLIAAMALTVVAVALAGSGGSDVAVDDPNAFSTEGDADAVDPGEQDPVAQTGAEPCPTDVEAPEVTAEPYDAAPEMTIDTSKVYVATIETTCGDIVMELKPEWAPNAVNNFVTLAQDDFYDGVPFHRVIDDFMIQGGDPTGTGHGNGGVFPGYAFEDELDRAEALAAEGGVYPRGTVAMANAGPDTNGSQFFIVQVDGWPPNPGPVYTVFGTVLEGMDVVDRIALGPADAGIAIDPVRMIDVQIEERDA